MELDLSTLAERLAQTNVATHHGPKCAVGVLLSRLDEADRVALVAALERDSGQQHEGIAEALADEGFFAAGGGLIRGHTVGWHRRGKCAC